MGATMSTATHKLPRVIRLDESDLTVFDRTAVPGEWAVPGGFEFLCEDESTLTGKKRQEFHCGFLGIESLGRSTLVAIANATREQYEETVTLLAHQLLERYGAPDAETAHAAARDEIEYAESLCNYEVNTLLALEREITSDGIKERFKRFVRPDGADWEQGKPLRFVSD